MIVTAGMAGLSWTVTRGAEGTIAATHANGATVTHVLTAGGLANLAATSLTLTGQQYTRWVPNPNAYGAPTSGTYLKGDWTTSNASGAVFLCKTAGTPGTWISANAWYDVRDYGATGDGITDDTTAIQNAITAATTGEVLLPPGTFRLSSAALTGRSGLVLRGAGQGITILKPVGALAALAFTSNNDITIRDLTIDGSLQTTGASIYGIYLLTCNRTRIYNCEVKTTWSDGIYVQGGADHWITDNHVHNTGDNQGVATTVHGIRASLTARAHINRNIVRDCTRRYGHGISAESNTNAGLTLDTEIGGNQVFNCGNAALSGGGGIAVYSSASQSGNRAQRGTVYGNVVFTSSDGGIWINADEFAVSANLVDTTNLGFGIEVSDCRDVTVSANAVLNATSSGIAAHRANNPAVVGLRNVVITNNVVDNCGASAAGIIATDDAQGTAVQQIVITGNTVRAAKDGIFLQGAVDCSIVSNTTMDNTNAGVRLGYGAGSAQSLRLLIEGNRSGDTRAGGSRTQVYGLEVDGTSLATQGDYLTVIGNDFQNNITQGLIWGFSANGTHSRVHSNFGYNPVGNGFPFNQPAVPASSGSITNTLGSDATVTITAGASTCTVAIGGVTAAVMPASSVGSFRVPVGQSITLTYANAPTWAWFGD